MGCVMAMSFAILFSLLLCPCASFSFFKDFEESTTSSPSFFEEYTTSGYRDSQGFLTEQDRNEACQPALSGHEWVLSRIRQDYGWGDDTHRAIIILALNDFFLLGSNEADLLLLQQLELELSAALLRNLTRPMLLGDLGLYIQALIITSRDPTNFHGINLVQILKARLNNECGPPKAKDTNVFALLVLSECRAIEETHVRTLRSVLQNPENNTKQKELKAIALHALACATEDGEFQEYSDSVSEAAAALARNQNKDGSFGNFYTTALVTQALIAAEQENGWNEQKATEFLMSKRSENVNMVSVYYLERVLNAHFQRCLKTKANYTDPDELGEESMGFPSLQELHTWPRNHYVQYSLRAGEQPEVYFTITMRVPKNATFFDIMRLCEAVDTNFRFSWYYDDLNYPTVYSISGIPNDAEESQYWRLIVETEIDHDRNNSKTIEFVGSPMSLVPEKDSHMIYWFRHGFEPLTQ